MVLTLTGCGPKKMEEKPVEVPKAEVKEPVKQEETPVVGAWLSTAVACSENVYENYVFNVDSTYGETERRGIVDFEACARPAFVIDLAASGVEFTIVK